MMKKAVFGIALFTAALAISFVGGLKADKDFEHEGDFRFFPGNLVVSRSVYHNDPDNVTVGLILPPNCASTKGACAAATGTTNNGTYPQVWNNNLYDGSFGVTQFGEVLRGVSLTPGTNDHDREDQQRDDHPAQ